MLLWKYHSSNYMYLNVLLFQFFHVNVRTEYLEATLGLVKRLEISKELIRECVTVPGCCCYIPLLYNHLIDLCSYLYMQKYITSRQRGCICTPLTPPKSTTVHIYM